MKLSCIIISLIGILIITFPTLHAQDFLQKARNYLDAGECEKAQKAYNAYKVEYPNGNAEVERRISECGQVKDLTFTVNNVTFKMVFVKGGNMYLGCTSGSGSCASDEKPSHNVTLTDFYMGETEVTQALWKAVMGYNNNPSKWKGDLLPVETVSWNDCKEFVNRLNSRLSSELPQGYRFALPSEAQWEYAARGGSKSNAYTYAGGNYIWDVGWYCANSNESTHAVGKKRANELGLYDMTGNVCEWCSDWYGSYSSSSQADPRGPSSGSGRVLRGGGFGSRAAGCRVVSRGSGAPGSPHGFRLALVRR